MLLMAVGILVFVLKYQRQMFRHELEVNKLEEQKEKELLTAYMSGEEEERQRIAAELHDDVACTLASIKLLLSAAQENSEEAAELTQMSKQLLDESLDQVRGISHRLQPSFLVQARLEGAITNLFNRLHKSGKIDAQMVVANTIPLMPDNFELTLFRVTQEIVNNLLKHAGPLAMRLELVLKEGTIRIQIVHNGDGLDQNTFEDLAYNGSTVGLKNMLSRIKQIGGNIFFEKSTGRDWLITISAPIPANS